MLLDSHVLLWRLDQSRPLGQAAAERLDRVAQIYVSAATVWELTIKSMRGKLSMPDDFEARIRERGYRPLPVTTQHAAGIRAFPELTRHDPFDRVLLAQAHLESLEFMTVDGVLLELDLPFVVDARR